MNPSQAEFYNGLKHTSESKPANSCTEAFLEGFRLLGSQIYLVARAFKREDISFDVFLDEMNSLSSRCNALQNLPGQRERGYAAHGLWLERLISAYQKSVERAA